MAAGARPAPGGEIEIELGADDQGEEPRHFLKWLWLSNPGNPGEHQNRWYMRHRF